MVSRVGFGAGGETSAKTLLKRGVFKLKKWKPPKNEEKSTKTLPDTAPPKIFGRAENCSENPAKTRCLEEKKKTPKTKTPVEKFQHKK